MIDTCPVQLVAVGVVAVQPNWIGFGVAEVIGFAVMMMVYVPLGVPALTSLGAPPKPPPLLPQAIWKMESINSRQMEE